MAVGGLGGHRGLYQAPQLSGSSLGPPRAQSGPTPPGQGGSNAGQSPSQLASQGLRGYRQGQAQVNNSNSLLNRGLRQLPGQDGGLKPGMEGAGGEASATAPAPLSAEPGSAISTAAPVTEAAPVIAQPVAAGSPGLAGGVADLAATGGASYGGGAAGAAGAAGGEAVAGLGAGTSAAEIAAIAGGAGEAFSGIGAAGAAVGAGEAGAAAGAAAGIGEAAAGIGTAVAGAGEAIAGSGALAGIGEGIAAAWPVVAEGAAAAGTAIAATAAEWAPYLLALLALKDGGRVDGPSLPGKGEAASGLIRHPSAGRADAVMTQAAVGSYVIPADVVSGTGEGNTEAGARVLARELPRGMIPGLARGGQVGGRRVPVRLSGGEYVVPPDQVMAVGGGDAKRGAEKLDRFVARIRANVGREAATAPAPR